MKNNTMKNKKNIGRNSLIVSGSLFILAETMILFGFPYLPALVILASAFEAATIGGLADWFAVTALFKEVKIPYVRRHTNIIIKNRQRLTEGVVDLVTNHWLAPDVITERLSGIKFSESVISIMRDNENRGKVIGFVRDIISRFTGELDKPEVAAFLERILKDQIEGVNMSKPIGKWLEESILRGDHDKIWEVILDTAGNTANDPSTRKLITEKVREAIEEYRKTGMLKATFIFIAEATKSLDQELVTNKILQKINLFISEAKADPFHPSRVKLNNSLLGFARQLSSGDPSAAETIADIQKRLLANADLKDIITGILNRFKTSVGSQLENNETHLMIIVKNNIDKIFSELSSDKAAQEKIDTWLRQTIISLVEKYHHTIGEMVRSSLAPGKLDDKGLVNQIRDKVGDDLQYIRLNGAVIGGSVGLIIAVVRYFLF